MNELQEQIENLTLNIDLQSKNYPDWVSLLLHKLVFVAEGDKFNSVGRIPTDTNQHNPSLKATNKNYGTNIG